MRQIESIRAGCQLHPQARRRFTVDASDNVIVFTAKFNPCDIFQAYHRAVTIYAQGHFAEFFRII